MPIVPRTMIRKDREVGRTADSLATFGASLLKFGDSEEVYTMQATKKSVIAATDTDLKNDIPHEYRLFAPRARFTIASKT